MDWVILLLTIIVLVDMLIDWWWLEWHGRRMDRIESKLDELLKRKDGKDGVDNS